MQPRPGPRHVVVTLAIVLTAAAVLALYAIPTSSPWFWPLAGLVAASGLLALVIPLNPRRPPTE